MSRVWMLVLLAAALPTAAESQSRGTGSILGTWRARTDDGWAHVVVRPDSSASLGDQTVRWRVVKDSLWLALGDGTWSVYGLRLHTGGRRLTVSGGDLDDPITLEKVGPPTPRSATAEVPPAPPDTARAIP